MSEPPTSAVVKGKRSSDAAAADNELIPNGETENGEKSNGKAEAKGGFAAKAQLRVLETALATSKKQVKELEAQLKNVTSRASDLEAQLAGQPTRAERKEIKEADKLQARIKELEDEIAANSKKLETKDAEIGRLNEKAKAGTKKTHELESTVQKLQQDIAKQAKSFTNVSEKESKMEEVFSILEQTQAQNETLQAQVEELEEKLEQTKQEAESALDEFIKAKKQEKRLRLHCKQMESRLGELEFRNSDSHIEKLEKKLKQAEDLQQATQQEADAVRQECEEYVIQQVALDKYTQQLEQKVAEQQNIERERDKWRTHAEQMQYKLKDAEVSLRTLELERAHTMAREMSAPSATAGERSETPAIGETDSPVAPNEAFEELVRTRERLKELKERLVRTEEGWSVSAQEAKRLREERDEYLQRHRDEREGFIEQQVEQSAQLEEVQRKLRDVRQYDSSEAAQDARFQELESKAKKAETKAAMEKRNSDVLRTQNAQYVKQQAALEMFVKELESKGGTNLMNPARRLRMRKLSQADGLEDSEHPADLIPIEPDENEDETLKLEEYVTDLENKVFALDNAERELYYAKRLLEDLEYAFEQYCLTHTCEGPAAHSIHRELKNSKRHMMWLDKVFDRLRHGWFATIQERRQLEDDEAAMQLAEEEDGGIPEQLEPTQPSMNGQMLTVESVNFGEQTFTSPLSHSNGADDAHNLQHTPLEQMEPEGEPKRSMLGWWAAGKEGADDDEDGQEDMG